MLGLGQLVGSPLVGYVNDKRGGGQSVARVLLVIHLLSYATILIYNEIHTFGVLSFVLTFLLGIQDAALQTQVTIVFGFEFSSAIEALAIYRLFNSIFICLSMASQSQLTTLGDYRVFFLICAIITIASQAVMAFKFEFKNRVS